MTEAQLPMLLLVPLFLGAVLVPAFGLRNRAWAHPVATIFLLAYASLAVRLFLAVKSGGTLAYHVGGWAPPVGIEFRVDMLSAFVALVIALISLLVSIYARVAVRAEIPDQEMPFYSVMFIMLLGLTGMVITADLFNLYVWFEVSSLAGYALMAAGSRKAPVSAFRYLIMGTLGASFYLMGVGYLYILTGSLNMADVSNLIASQGQNPALLVSLVLMVAGLGLKMALFPMHLWLPDAYTYASSTATALIAPVMTKVSAYVLLRMLFFVYDADLVRAVLPIDTAIVWLGLAGVVVGSVMAIAQNDVKRMLAYSSVAQVAYIAIGIGIGNAFALIGAILHVLNHATMKSCLFLATGAVQMRTGGTRMENFVSIGRTMPWTGLAFAVGGLSMIGIPPTNGFFSKWYLVLGAIDTGQWAVVALIVASGLLTGVYFFRLLVRIYTNPREGQTVSEGTEIPLSMRLPMLILALAMVLLGIFNSWFVTEVLQYALPPGMPRPF